MEQSPQSMDKRITIMILEPDMKTITKTEIDENKLVFKDREIVINKHRVIGWYMKLNPGEKRICKMKFSIEYLCELWISGL